MTNAVRIDSRKKRPKHLGSIPFIRRVRLLSQGLRTIAEDSRPLRNRIVVVCRCNRRVNTPMVDLHAGTCAFVSGIGVKHPLRPPLRGRVDLSARAIAVPSGHRIREEAPGRDARVVDHCCEEIRVRRCEDALSFVSAHPNNGKKTKSKAEEKKKEKG